LYDLANIEVLEGPQGTIYGRNSNGGTINILTNPAVLGRTTAGAEVEVGDYDLLRTSAYANLPLTDTLAARAAFQTQSHSGYMQSGLDDENEQSGRLSLMWKPDALRPALAASPSGPKNSSPPVLKPEEQVYLSPTVDGTPFREMSIPVRVGDRCFPRRGGGPASIVALN